MFLLQFLCRIWRYTFFSKNSNHFAQKKVQLPKNEQLDMKEKIHVLTQNISDVQLYLQTTKQYKKWLEHLHRQMESVLSV